MSSEPLIGAGQHADPSAPSVNGMPERAYVAMTTLKLRLTQDAIGRLEDELRSIDVDASVDELQGRLRRMLRERRRLHAEELSSAQEVADERVRALKSERERSAAATARSVTVLPTVVSPEPADDELPEWWPVPAEADEPDVASRDDSVSPPAGRLIGAPDLPARRNGRRGRCTLTSLGGLASPRPVGSVSAEALQPDSLRALHQRRVDRRGCDVRESEPGDG